MADKIKNLPYFNIKPSHPDRVTANFLLRKFRTGIKRKFNQHYLVQPRPSKSLEFIKAHSKKYPYFLRFDIRLYYPSINHQILLEKTPGIYHKLSLKPASRRFKKYLKNNLPGFLAQSPYGKGLSVGTRLSWVLAGIFLLDLDLGIPRPFLRQTDDYLIFCKNKREPENLLKNIILPKLQELKLEINEKKLKSGKFHQDKVNFIGFDFYSGYIRISEDKFEEFKQRIKTLAYLTRKKSVPATIKLLNNQILGFGHYYKFASCKNDFEDLDSFTRMRLRRWLLNQKELLPKQGNLILTNAVLQNMGLKSLLEIKEKFDPKKKTKNKKIGKSNAKTCQFKKSPGWAQFEEIEFKSQQKLILAELKGLTGLVKKLERRIANLEKEVVNENKSEKSEK